MLLIEYPMDAPSRKTPAGQQENIRAIRLSANVGDLAGAAILIDKIIGTVTQSELDDHSTRDLFSPEHVPTEAFLPYRWI